MNYQTNIWRLGLCLIFLFLLFTSPVVAVEDISPESFEELAVASGNPIMIIRCRNFEGDGDSFISSPDNKTNNSKVEDPCPPGYDIGEGGCYPDCSELMVAPPGHYYRYDEPTGMCVCEIIPESPSLTSKESSAKEVETCVDFPFEPCFDGELLVDVPFIDCGNMEGDLAFVRLCFTSADPSNPLIPGQKVPFTDIQNCFGDADEPLLQAAIIANGGMGPVGSEQFVFDAEVNEDNKLCVEFYIDPSEPIVINFVNMVEPVEIKTPCASDPCSCTNPDNIRVNGEVVRFADVLSLTNLPPGVTVGLNSNNNPNGFTNAAGLPYTGESLGVADGDGNLEFEFYRSSNQGVDIAYQYPDAANNNIPVVQTFVNGMTCDVTDCAVIPTMGQWSLLILAMLLSSIGLVFLGRRRLA